MVLLVVGSRGTGKTTFAKSLLKNYNNALILDLYNEYNGQIIKNLKPPNEGHKRVRESAADSENFFKMLSKLHNNFILIEDATIIFSGSIFDRDLKRLIIASRHRKNTICFLFHSLQRIPLFLFEQANNLVLFKTVESKQTFYKLGQHLEPYYNELKKSKNQHKKIIINL